METEKINVKHIDFDDVHSFIRNFDMKLRSDEQLKLQVDKILKQLEDEPIPNRYLGLTRAQEKAFDSYYDYYSGNLFHDTDHLPNELREALWKLKELVCGYFDRPWGNNIDEIRRNLEKIDDNDIRWKISDSIAYDKLRFGEFLDDEVLIEYGYDPNTIEDDELEYIMRDGENACIDFYADQIQQVLNDYLDKIPDIARLVKIELSHYRRIGRKKLPINISQAIGDIGFRLLPINDEGNVLSVNAIRAIIESWQSLKKRNFKFAEDQEYALFQKAIDVFRDYPEVLRFASSIECAIVEYFDNIKGFISKK